jgi:pimeloyl-ACP methyl ester carboxylesterase
MARFVLVHGAWHGGWCFGKLADALRARGHLVSAPDLPCDTVGLDQLDYAAALGRQPDAIVVGHSLGGQTIAHVEARRRVYLGAILPVAEQVSDALRDDFGGTARDELGRSYWPDADTAAARLFPDCGRPQADWAFARLRPQAPVSARSAPLDRGDVVIAMTRDVAVDPDWQLAQAQAHGLQAFPLDAGHFPFFTHPGDLADLLDSLAD